MKKSLSDNPVTQAIDEPQKANKNAPIRAPISDRTYFEFARPELLALIPRSAKRVLELGCGAGRLGESLKARQECEVIGVELDPEAAAAARTRLDRVLVGDIEELSPGFERCFEGETLDCVIAGDVLEHLRYPDELLVHLRACLKPDGCLVASIPNVRHHSVVRSLIEGNWTYEPAGLLDNTHLRFFTRRNIEELFSEAGFRIVALSSVPGPDDEESESIVQSGSIQLGRLQLANVPVEEAREFFVYQYLVVASVLQDCVARPAFREGRETNGRRLSTPFEDSGRATLPCLRDSESTVKDGAHEAAHAPANASKPEALARDCAPAPQSLRQSHIVLPSCLLLMITYNRLAYTRPALSSVLALDYPNLQVVVWDNASTDGTVDYLRDRLDGVSNARFVASPRNMGVCYPMNAVWWGDERCELLAKVDNDTLVPADLLRRLAACHVQSTKFGVLSGFHFRQEGESLATPDRINTYDGVVVLPQPYVGGCAVMLRREVLEKVGPIPYQLPDQATTEPFMDSGWTVYQQQLGQWGLVNGYPWPPIHVDHMEDTRSSHCIRSAEHEAYKRTLRGMGLDEFTEALCVWRPNWGDEHSNGQKAASRFGAEVQMGPERVGG